MSSIEMISIWRVACDGVLTPERISRIAAEFEMNFARARIPGEYTIGYTILASNDDRATSVLRLRRDRLSPSSYFFELWSEDVGDTRPDLRQRVQELARSSGSEDNAPVDVLLWFPRFDRTLAAAASDGARDRARKRLRHDHTGIDVQWEDRAASGVRLAMTVPAAESGDFVRVAVRWPDWRIDELVAPAVTTRTGLRVARVTIPGRSSWIEVGVRLPLLSRVEVLDLPDDTIARSLRWATRSSRDVGEWRRVARSSTHTGRTLIDEWLRTMGRGL